MNILICGTNNYNALFDMIIELKRHSSKIVFLDFDNKLVSNNLGSKIKDHVDVYQWIEEGLCETSLTKAIHKLNKENNFDYAITTLTYIVEAFARICDREGIKFSESSSISLIKNKHNLQLMLQAGNLPYIKSKMMDGNGMFDESACMTFPLIVKPVNGACSINVSKVNNLEELNNEQRSKYSSFVSDEYVVEEFKKGDLVSCEALVNKASVKPMAFSLRERSKDNEAVELGSILPAPISRDIQNKMYEILSYICQETKLTRGMLHAEFIVSENEPYLIDLNPRMPGVNIPALYRASYEQNMARLASLAYLDKNVIVEGKPHRVAMNRLLGLRSPLTIDNIYEKLQSETWEENVSVQVAENLEGLSIAKINSDYFGEVFVTGLSHNEVRAKMFRAYSRLQDIFNGSLLIPLEEDD